MRQLGHKPGRKGGDVKMDRSTIINTFYCCKVKDRCSIDCLYWDGKSTFNECMKRLYDDVYSLLKEQEAVEPIDIIDEKYPVGDSNRYKGYRCGKCKEGITWDANYCPYCGRMVKWE